MKAPSERGHLTDAEFTDLLAGEPASAAVQAHLAACAFCREEHAVVSGSLLSFQELSTSWAQSRAVAQVPVPSPWSVRLSGLPSWRAGLAAMALSGVVAFHFAAPHRAPQVAVDAAVPAVATAMPTKAELADDNRLMLSINQELSYHTSVAVPTNDLGSETHTVGHQGAETIEN